MRHAFLILMVATSLAKAETQQQHPTTNASWAASKNTGLPPSDTSASTNRSTALTYEYEALEAPRWNWDRRDLPTYGNSDKSATNVVRVLIRGNATKRPGYYLISKGSRVLHAIEAAQMRVPFDLSESGLQRAATNGTWAFVHFHTPRQSPRETPRWAGIPVWKLIPLEDGDQLQITLPPPF